MNRNEEYEALLSELEETPLKLDFTLERAQLKREAQKRRSRKAIFTPLGTVAAVFAVFVVLVNLSPTFAYAAGRLPVLRDLAKFVAFSPSLSAAVENEFVQPIGLEQTANGITARIEYVIVDQKQLNVFYTLSSEAYPHLTSYLKISSADDRFLEGYSIVSGSIDAENGQLRKATVDFSKGTMPDSLVVKLQPFVSESQDNTTEATLPSTGSYESSFFEDNYTVPETVAEFSFTISFDSSFTTACEIINLNKSFTLDGQTLILSSVEIYPTHMRFVFDDDENNTAWLKELKFYVEDEHGERFGGISNGVSAFGKEGSPMMGTYMLESTFFSKSKHLTLCITDATWLDKDMERVHIDLENKTADVLPDSAEFESAEKMESGWLLTFSSLIPKSGGNSQIWTSTYYDPNGTEQNIGTMSFSSGFFDPETGEHQTPNGRGEQMFALKDYPYDEVWLCPTYSSRTTLDTPLSIEIK